MFIGIIVKVTLVVSIEFLDDIPRRLCWILSEDRADGLCCLTELENVFGHHRNVLERGIGLVV